MSQQADRRGPADERPPGDRLGLTTNLQVAIALLAGAVLGYFIVGTMQWRGVSVPVTPWSLPVMLLALGVGALVYARSLRGQVAERRGALSSEAAVRALVLGKTLLMTGVVMAGGHALYVATNLSHMDAPLPLQRVVRGALTILASLVFAWGGWAVERACLVPPDDESRRNPQGEVDSLTND